VKIAFTADWHIGVSTHSTNKVGIPSRTQDSIDSVNKIINKAKDLNCDTFIVGGDLFHHSNPRPAFIFEAVKLLQYANRMFEDIIVISGNHDPMPLNGGVGSIGLLTNMNDIPHNRMYEEDADLLITKREEKVHLSIRPYQKKTQVMEKPMSLDNEAPIIMIAHHHFQGAVVGSETRMLAGGVSVIEELDGVSLILSGHIHKPQHIKTPKGVSVLYPGSPARFYFSDRDDTKGFWVIETEGKSVNNLDFIEIENRPMVQIERDARWLSQSEKKCLKDLKKVKGADVKTIISCDDVLEIDIVKMVDLLKKAGAHYIVPPKIELRHKDRVREEEINRDQNKDKCVDLWLESNDLGQFEKEEIKQSADKIMQDD